MSDAKKEYYEKKNNMSRGNKTDVWKLSREIVLNIKKKPSNINENGQ